MKFDLKNDKRILLTYLSISEIKLINKHLKKNLKLSQNDPITGLPSEQGRNCCHFLIILPFLLFLP